MIIYERSKDGSSTWRYMKWELPEIMINQRHSKVAFCFQSTLRDFFVLF